MQELMTPCTTQSSFGRTKPLAMATSCPAAGFMKHSYHMNEPVWIFDVGSYI